jgi:hypothetical protein
LILAEMALACGVYLGAKQEIGISASGFTVFSGNVISILENMTTGQRQGLDWLA